MPSPVEDIRTLVREMNETWLRGRVEELERFFVPNTVIAPPSGDGRVVGRDAVVESFRQYTEHAVTHRFDVLDVQVDVIDTTAVAIMHFAIRYEIGGSTYDETGRDILVLVLGDAGWRIAWRTQFTDETTEA